MNFSGPIDDPEMDITAISMKIYRREGAEIRAAPLWSGIQHTHRLLGAALPTAPNLLPKKSCARSCSVRRLQEEASILTRAPPALPLHPSPNSLKKNPALMYSSSVPVREGINDLSSGSLEVGTYLTDRLFIRVLQPIETIQSGQEVSIEYQLKEWLKLIAEQKGREQSAFDIFVQLEWR